MLCFYSAHPEFTPQDIANWFSKACTRIRINSAVALRVVKVDEKGTQCRGYNSATLFLENINTMTWAPGRRSLISERVKRGHESCGNSYLRLKALAKVSSNWNRQTHPLV
jgi:hypothetical protein